MPIYEYRCQECGRRFERLQPMSAGTEGVTCPYCDGARVERQFSSFASTSSDTCRRTSHGAGAGGG